MAKLFPMTDPDFHDERSRFRSQKVQNCRHIYNEMLKFTKNGRGTHGQKLRTFYKQ